MIIKSSGDYAGRGAGRDSDVASMSVWLHSPDYFAYSYTYIVCVSRGVSPKVKCEERPGPQKTRRQRTEEAIAIPNSTFKCKTNSRKSNNSEQIEGSERKKPGVIV